MGTPAEVYAPSARKFPEPVREPEYAAPMLVRSVRRQGHFRWKQEEVFLSEVLWGERVGLLPEDDRWFTIYIAHLPLARFDSWKLEVTPLPKITEGFYSVGAGEGEASPSPASHPLLEQHQKVSGMCPV